MKHKTKGSICELFKQDFAFPIGQLFRKMYYTIDFDYPEWIEDIDLGRTTLDYFNRMIAAEVRCCR